MANIAINGIGRIGKLVLQILINQKYLRSRETNIYTEIQIFRHYHPRQEPNLKNKK